MTNSRLGVALVSATLLTSTLAFAQNNNEETSKTNFITLFSAGVDTLLASPVDSGLRNALGMIDFSSMPMPGMQDKRAQRYSQAIYDMLTDEMSLSIDVDVDELKAAMSGQGMTKQVYSLQLDVYGKNADQNKFYSDQVGSLIANTNMFGTPVNSTKDPSLSFVKSNEPDAPEIYYGSTMLGGKPAFVMALNDMTKEPVSLSGYGAFRMDMGVLQPFMEMAMSQAERSLQTPQTSMAMSMLKQAGIMNDPPTVISFAMGQAKDRTYMAGSYTNCGELLDRFISSSGLTIDDMKLIPQNTTYAAISKINLPKYMNFYLDMMSQMAGQSSNPNAPKPMEMLNNMLGFNVQTQFVDYFGETFGMYQAPDTGGQSILAMVAFLELSNSEGMKKSMSQLIESVNKNLSAGPPVQLIEYQVKGNDMTTLSFPGMPIPLELSMGIGSNHLFLGFSPQSVLAAMEQASGDKMSLLNKSILDNPKFTSMGGDRYAGAIQAQFLDTEAYLSSGYSLTNLGFAAISNLSRRPGVADSGVAMVMPTYNELAKDVRASVSLTRRQGNDLVYEAELDRSLLVNATAMVGCLKQLMDFVPVAALLAAN